jgi:hypothetical protein
MDKHARKRQGCQARQQTEEVDIKKGSVHWPLLLKPGKNRATKALAGSDRTTTADSLRSAPSPYSSNGFVSLIDVNSDLDKYQDNEDILVIPK